MEYATHRACAQCRTHKTRCVPDGKDPNSCSRCARFKRQCIATQVGKRKPRNRAGDRVAELEKELLVLRALIQHRDDSACTASGSISGIGHGASASLVSSSDPTDQRFQRPGKLVATTVSEQLSEDRVSISQLRNVAARVQQQLVENPRSNEHELGHDGDVVDENIISMATARQLLDEYRKELYPHYPIVHINKECTIDELRSTKPTLFLAIVAGSAGRHYPDLAAKLDKVLLEEFANRIIVKSEKSMELLQSLLVSAVWFQPPCHFDQLKFYEYIHMAANIAMDIGIRTAFRVANHPRQGMQYETSSTIQSNSDSCPELEDSLRMFDVYEEQHTIESMRSFLAIYITSANATITLRRPPILRISSHVQACVDRMEQLPPAVSNDRVLTLWACLFMIAEEIGSSFSYDDPAVIASILDTKTQLMMTAFERRLTQWRRNTADLDCSPMMLMTYYTVRLYLYELALHVDYAAEDFKAPYQMGRVHPVEDSQISVKPLVEAVAELVQSSQALLDSFMSIQVTRVRAIPVFGFVRVSFAAFILAKLCVSATSRDSRLAELISRSSLQAELYIDKVMQRLRDAIGPNGCRVPAIFLILLSNLRQWCCQPELMLQADVETNPAPNRSLMAVRSRVSEGVGSSPTSPETVRSGPYFHTAVLTGSAQANYSSFAGDEAVKFATDQSRSEQTIDVSASREGSQNSADDRSIEPNPWNDNDTSAQSSSSFLNIAITTTTGAGEASGPGELDVMDWHSNVFPFLGDVNFL